MIVTVLSLLCAASAAPKQHIVYDEGYGGDAAVATPGMGAHTGPSKMPRIADAIVRERLVDPAALHTNHPEALGAQPGPEPVALEDLRKVHSDGFLQAILTGSPDGLARSQGLRHWSKAIARGWLLNTGGLLAAARIALREMTFAGNLGHGYHHAMTERGMGFCTVNGLAVVAQKLAAEGKKVLIVDLDVHEGNGTADMVLGSPNIEHLSLYGAYMNGPSAAPNNHVARVAMNDVNYLAAVADRLPALIAQKPALILFQAGMDPFDTGISREALQVRDAYVFALARAANIPVAWVLAGGYSALDNLVTLHTNTVRAGNAVLEKIATGAEIRHAGENPHSWSVADGVAIFPDWQRLAQQNGGLKIEPREQMSPAEVKAYVAAREAKLAGQDHPNAALAEAYRAALEH